jgi:hypothetical protein
LLFGHQFAVRYILYKRLKVKGLHDSSPVADFIFGR